jgi:hypothetical protein
MSDKMYEEFNNISFDEAEFNLKEESLTEVEIKKLKNNLKKKVYKTNRKHLKIAASIALTAIIGIAFVTPTFAHTIGQYIPVMDAIYEKLGYYEEFKDFSQYIGVSKEDKGYKFTIDKLVADKDTVLVALRVSRHGLNAGEKNAYKKSDFIMTADLSGIRRGTIMGGGVEERVLDENTSLVLLENQTGPGKSLPKRFNMNVNINSMFDGNVHVNFDFPVSREKIQNETIVKKDLGKTAIGEQAKIKLHELKASPVNTSIKYSYEGKLEGNSYISFYVYDDKGRIYVGSGERADDSGYRISTLSRIEEDANKLYIIPYVNVRDNNYLEKYKSLDFFEKFFSIDTERVFDFKEDGKVNVYKVEEDGNSIKIYYSLEGTQSALNKGYVINLYESNGDKLEDKIWVSTRNAKLYKPDGNKPDNYCIEFTSVDTSKDYVYEVSLHSMNKAIEGRPIEVNLR